MVEQQEIHLDQFHHPTVYPRKRTPKADMMQKQ
jgi:hypothetical protein